MFSYFFQLIKNVTENFHEKKSPTKTVYLMLNISNFIVHLQIEFECRNLFI